jgi:hypothetical protein
MIFDHHRGPEISAPWGYGAPASEDVGSPQKNLARTTSTTVTVMAPPMRVAI